MSKEDLVQIEGKVVEVAAGGKFIVEGPKGMRLPAQLAGKLRRKHIRVILGDYVTVSVSPYDPSHGLITYRGKDSGRVETEEEIEAAAAAKKKFKK